MKNNRKITEKILKEMKEKHKSWVSHPALNTGRIKRLFEGAISLALKEKDAEINKVIDEVGKILEKKSMGDTHPNGCGDPSECHYWDGVFDIQEELKNKLGVGK